jgi:uncharacterized protein (TIGR00299 family) protein
MKVCYFDAFSGISGDMTVGALVDAGADWGALTASLESLGVGVTFRIEKTKRKGIAASKFTVESSDQKKHRHFPEIERIIGSGDLTDRARRNAISVFHRLGEAEARSHNVPMERVHFHEVGAVDSICDVVGACVALDLLEVEKIRSSRINVGSGTVNTEHGVLPVPAPATAYLLADRPIYSAGPETELTTPTGAALVSTLAEQFGVVPPMRVLSQGFGAGEKDFPTQANVLRVLIGEQLERAETLTINVIQANIDDSTPQVLGYAMEQLLEAGALDVTLTPIFMKKNRPATMISVICSMDTTERMTALLFSETTTLGVRILQAQREVVTRKSTEIDTTYGKVRIKFTESGSFTPEYEDCRRAAREHGIPLRAVIAEANQAFRRLQNS